MGSGLLRRRARLILAEQRRDVACIQGQAKACALGHLEGRKRKAPIAKVADQLK